MSRCPASSCIEPERGLASDGAGGMDTDSEGHFLTVRFADLWQKDGFRGDAQQAPREVSPV